MKLLTASVWIGCTLNIKPARVANGGFNPAIRKQTLVNNRHATACRAMLVRWNATGLRPKHR